jgi:predicted nucleic acid-binding protein
MSGKVFLDTNIFMYALDAAQGAKHERALFVVENLWSSGRAVLSTQVLQELCINLRQKVRPPLSGEAVYRIIGDYLSWPVVVNTGESVLGALEIEARYQISFWDALIVQAAQTAGAETLYSEDLNDGQVYGSVRVVNPLKA